MGKQPPLKAIFLGLTGFLALVFTFGSYYVVEPGHRGIKVTLGSVSPNFLHEGLNFKMPIISQIIPISIRQSTREVSAECFSSDLQQIDIKLKVLFRVPEKSIVTIFQKYSGDPLESLISPRIQEALKEATASESAEQIVKKREMIKVKALQEAQKKISDLLIIEDLVIENISLSKELEEAIEAKMVQEQEAAKAKYIKQKVEIEAQTMLLKAEAEAKAIKIRGQAIKENPGIVDLQIVEKWDGKSPMVVGSDGKTGTQILLPISKPAK